MEEVVLGRIYGAGGGFEGNLTGICGVGGSSGGNLRKICGRGGFEENLWGRRGSEGNLRGNFGEKGGSEGNLWGKRDSKENLREICVQEGVLGRIYEAGGVLRGQTDPHGVLGRGGDTNPTPPKKLGQLPQCSASPTMLRRRSHNPSGCPDLFSPFFTPNTQPGKFFGGLGTN